MGDQPQAAAHAAAVTMPPVIRRFSKPPSALTKQAKTVRLGPTQAPALLVHPDWSSPAPTIVWMHGRTVDKTFDPGRYLRWLRCGYAACALDLVGHGDRFDDHYHQPAHTLEAVEQTLGEIDGIVDALVDWPDELFDARRLAIGGMSAGGMVALARCCTTHPFRCIVVEATAGDWAFQRRRALLAEHIVARLNPIDRLERWSQVPLQAIHSEKDELVPEAAMGVFIETLRMMYREPELIEYVTYRSTGAPAEHAGFGRKTRNARQRQVAFLDKHLRGEAPGERPDCCLDALEDEDDEAAGGGSG
jgi:dienelactone hydrolase